MDNKEILRKIYDCLYKISQVADTDYKFGDEIQDLKVEMHKAINDLGILINGESDTKTG